MEIDKKVIEELRESANILMLHELKSYYLLGDTDEYDNFEPEKVNEASATPFEIYKKACCMYAGYKTKEDEKKWKEFLSYHFPNHYASSILKEDLIDNGFWSKRIGVSPEGYGWISARFSHCGKFIDREIDIFILCVGNH